MKIQYIFYKNFRNFYRSVWFSQICLFFFTLGKSVDDVHFQIYKFKFLAIFGKGLAWYSHAIRLYGIRSVSTIFS